ncbi:MAG: TIM44-like domain-containing protein [Proteobacteria bacterium]|nr:TIM44-like domain-containing protein [Pseudomonadota bacterium]
MRKHLISLFVKYVPASRRAQWFSAAWVVLSIMILALEAFARAGGGESYSGGGGGGGGGYSGGGGGGGGGDGGGEIILLLLMLAFKYPVIGVPLLVGLIVAAIVYNKLNPDNTTKQAIKKIEQIPAPDRTALPALLERDPAFSEADFIARIQKLEHQVQAAWVSGSMEVVRSSLSDGLFRRFESQLGIMRLQNTRNMMADHQIHKCQIHTVEHDAFFDTIHVAIEASSRDVQVTVATSDAEAKQRAAKAKRERYTEIWSFLRRPGARTLATGGALEGRCPNCGAPLENAQTARCTHCQALVNSGDYDWVLAEITQPIEWRPGSTGSVSGLKDIMERDPTFNRQVAEDRAGYVFWRWMEALVRRSRAPLAQCATPAFVESVSREPLGAVRHYRTAVGAVDLVAVINDDTFERIYIKVLWSSARSPRAIPIPATTVLVLSRRMGVAGKTGFSHARCPSCHGPLPENDATTCEYCGAALGSADTDWVLEETLSLNGLAKRVSRAKEAARTAFGQSSAAGYTGADDDDDPEDASDESIPEWATPDMGNRRERLLLLMRMAAVVMADGVVTRQERRLLKTAARRWDVPFEAVEPILTGQIDPLEVEMMRPAAPQAFFNGLVSAALIDGKIDGREEKLLLDVATSLGISQADAKNTMYAMTKTARSGSSARV